MRTAAARTVHNAPPAPQTQPTFNIPAKRPRTQNTPELTQEEKRGRGRPTNIELAARDRSQSRLRLSTPHQPQNGTSAYLMVIPSSFPLTQGSFPFTANCPTRVQPSQVPSSFLSSLGSLKGSQERPQPNPETNSTEDISMDTPQESNDDL